MKLLPIAMIAALAACAPEADERPGNDIATAANATARAEPRAPASTANAAAPTPAEAGALTADGWGPLRIGMTRADIEAALGKDADPGAVGGPEPEICDQFRPRRAPADMLVMVEKGALTRISLVRGADIATDRGLRLNDSAARVRAAYGDTINAEPHAYTDPEGGYLTVWARGGGTGEVRDAAARGIRYEIGTDDRVKSIHAGGPSIQNVEGCL